MSEACLNTDRELWRGPDEGGGDFYADSIHVTENGGIGINCGGTVFVKPLREWYALAAAARLEPPPSSGHGYTGDFTAKEFHERAFDHEKAAKNGLSAGPNVSYVRTMQACAHALRLAAPLLPVAGK